MFPHTITIYNYVEETDEYSWQVLHGVYWHGSNSVPISTSREHSGSTKVTIPKALMKYVYVKIGAYVAKGAHKPITSMSKLKDVEYFTVTDIKVNDAGWDVDNMIISGS